MFLHVNSNIIDPATQKERERKREEERGRDIKKTIK